MKESSRKKTSLYCEILNLKLTVYKLENLLYIEHTLPLPDKAQMGNSRVEHILSLPDESLIIH